MSSRGKCEKRHIDFLTSIYREGISQTAAEAVNERGRWLSDPEKTDAPDLARFLRPPHERPYRRPAEQRDELAAL